MVDNKLQQVTDAIRMFPDFPKPGFCFMDIFPLLKNPTLFSDLVGIMTDRVRGLSVDVVVGLESRGFLFGPIIAHQLKIPFIPIRKKGKLPGPTIIVEYELDYGSDIFEAQLNSISKGKKVVIVDDLLATGGTVNAACHLVEKMEGVVVEALVVIGPKEMDICAQVKTNVHSLIKF